jgi:flagellar hook protein FlgE
MPGFLLAAALSAGCGGLGEGEAACRLIAGPEIQRQGQLVPTGIATDLAVVGSGFFLLDDGGPWGTPLLTRAGRFTVDREGYLVNLDSLRVLGWAADDQGVLSSAPGHLHVGAGPMAARATTHLMMAGNLQADAPVTGAFDPANPNTTSNFSSSMTAYDAQGRAHPVQVFFTKAAVAATGNAWTWSALADGGGLQGGTAGTLQVIAGGELTFDTSGRLAGAAPLVPDATAFHPLGASEPQPLRFNFGDPTGELGSGLLGLTQFASPSASTFVGQDGFSPGVLRGLEIDLAGLVHGLFTNGRDRVLAQVALAQVPAPVFLAAETTTLLRPTEASGPAALTEPCAEGSAAGCLVAGSVESLSPPAATCRP